MHLPGYLAGLGGREAEIGIIVGTLSVSAILVRPWLGRTMDRRGRRPVLWLGAVVNLFAVSLYLTAGSLGPWIYIIRIIHGVAEAALFSVSFTIAADLVPASRRTEGIAIFGVSGLLPLSLGGLLGDWILMHWDYTALFAVSAGIALVGLFLCIPIPETRPSRNGDAPSSMGLVEIALDRTLLPLWIMTLGFSFALTSYFTFLKTYVGEIGAGSVGLFFLGYSVVAVGMRIFFSWIPERFGAKRVLTPALLSLVAGIVTLAVADSSTLVLSAGALCGLGHAYIFPIISALVVSRADIHHRGAALTLFTALFDVAALIGAPLLGFVIEVDGYTTMFVAAAGVALVLTALFFLLDRGR